MDIMKFSVRLQGCLLSLMSSLLSQYQKENFSDLEIEKLLHKGVIVP